jgi:hypothetical protein
MSLFSNLRAIQTKNSPLVQLPEAQSLRACPSQPGPAKGSAQIAFDRSIASEAYIINFYF